MVFQLRYISRFLLINDSFQEELKCFYSFSWVPVWISSIGVDWLSVIEANFLSFLSFPRPASRNLLHNSIYKYICDGVLCGSNLPGHCWQLLSLPSPRNHGSFSSRVPFLGNGNGVNCELGTGKFSQRKVVVNLQNIFVMDVFVVQAYPITVGSCFHYPLQGIMDHFHQGFHSLERVMELIVNWERASSHKGRWWSTCKTYLWWMSLWFKLTRSLLAVAFITLSKESWIIFIRGYIPWKG
jgi:hypothetical protein